MKSIFKPSCCTWDFSHSRKPTVRIACLAFCALLALPTAATLADRGGGSIRAAARPAPGPARAAPAPQRAAPAPQRAAPEPRRAAPEESRGPAHVEPPHAAPEVHRDVHVEPPRHIEVPARRDWDDHDVDIRHGGGFAHGASARFMRGQHFHDLPHHRSFRFNNVDYFYDDDGNYYLQEGGDYVDVQPPVGGLVAELPPGAETVGGGPTPYYYLDGIFYLPQGDAFVVVNPPPGIVVPDLPSGANQIVVNGNAYYQFGGFNYIPSIQDGVTVYTVTPM
jgi:hypothetical protein